MTLNTYIVRIYRRNENKPRMLVGVVEEVGVEGKKAFTNIDELWDILKSVPPSAKKEIERRNEVRTKKEISFIFVYKKHNLDASTMNYSKNGLGIKIHRKIALPVGDVLNIQARDSLVKAQVMWVKKEIDPPITMAGLKIVQGALNLKGVRRSEHLMMREEHKNE